MVKVEIRPPTSSTVSKSGSDGDEDIDHWETGGNDDGCSNGN